MEYEEDDFTPSEEKVMVEITVSALSDLLEADDVMYREGIGPDLKPLIKKILKAFRERKGTHVSV